MNNEMNGPKQIVAGLVIVGGTFLSFIAPAVFLPIVGGAIVYLYNDRKKGIK
jgi:uncharacterized membrane protein